MRNSVFFMFTILLCLAMFMPAEAAGKTPAERTLAESFGYTSGAMLFLSLAPWFIGRMLRKKKNPALERLNKGVLQKFHPVFGMGAIGYGTLHLMMYDRCHLSIQLGMALVGLFTLTGFLLYVRLPKKQKKLVRKVHYSGILGTATIALIVIGHLIV